MSSIKTIHLRNITEQDNQEYTCNQIPITAPTVNVKPIEKNALNIPNQIIQQQAAINNISRQKEGSQDIQQKQQQLIVNNLQNLDEIMFLCNQQKARSSSISVDQNEIQHQTYNEREDLLKMTPMSSKQIIEGFLEMKESVTCSEQYIGTPSVQEDPNTYIDDKDRFSIQIKGDDQNQNSPSQKLKNSNENEYQNKRFQNKMIIMQQIQGNGIDEESTELQDISPMESRMTKIKNRMNVNALSTNQIQQKGDNLNEQDKNLLQMSESQNQNYSKSYKDSNPDFKPIQQNELQKEEKINQSQLFTQLLKQNQNQYDSVEAIQNDEFTLMFQSTCPIKSPTFQRTKKTNQLQNKMSTSIENSVDKNLNQSSNQLKEGIKCEQNQTNKDMIESKKSNIIEEQYKGTSQQLQSYVDNNIISLAQVEQSSNNLEQSKEGIQLGFIADIKSIRNHKANAFRSKLNLSFSYQDTDNDEFRKKSASISSDFVMLIKEPVSIKDLQKANSTNYNTAESPGVSRKYKAQQKRAQYLNQKQNQHIEETNDEHKDYDNQQSQHLEHDDQSSTHDIECSIEKKQLRKFQRKQLIVKVSNVKDEQKEEVWDSDEIPSTDQNIQEEPIVTKAKQGSNKFEDIYCLQNGRQLGEGSSGIVYLCKKIKGDDETIYAVKVIRNVDEEMSKSIFQTFGIQYRLQHEFISRVYEVYFNEDSQTVHYIMEFIPYRPLDIVLRDKKGTLKETEASSIIQKLLKAVMYMEQRGVCHRDLKPENILISDDLQQIKIIDFGISKSFVKSQRVQHITQYYKHKMYTPTGTPHYKAPEILLGAGYTQLVDMWAVGVIAYQLISSGKHPFKCDSQIEQDLRIMKYQFDQSTQEWINSSADSKNFIKQLLNKNRMPAFEALKHPWIDQRKIEVIADDDNHKVSKQEKKPQGDSMTISVPVHFQTRLFNFGITVTNSEQQQKSNFPKRGVDGEVFDSNSIPLRACNTMNPNNQFENYAPSGNTNAQISSYTQKGKSIKNGGDSKIQSGENIQNTVGEEQQDGKDKQSIAKETKVPIINKKKHAIQGFASTQDVVHVVMRQKLSESREKMMQFFLKANTIIKNLEEEQFNQMNPKAQTLKRTHSVEKQCDSPISPEQIYSKNLININNGNIGSGIGLNVCHNVVGSNSKNENVQSFHMDSNQHINGVQHQNSQPCSSSSQDDKAMSKYNNSLQCSQQNIQIAQTPLSIQNSTDKNTQETMNSLRKNIQTIVQNNNQSNYYNNPSIPSSNAMNYSTSDFSNMKFSSLVSRKTSMNRQPQKRITRRNSTQQVNCMEKSIIFTKEVIGELYQDPVIQEKFGVDASNKSDMNTSMNPQLFAYNNSMGDNQYQEQFQNMEISQNNLRTISNLAFLSKKQTYEASQVYNSSNPSTNSNIRISQSNICSNNQSQVNNSYQQPVSIENFSKSDKNYITEEEKKQEENKWRLIADHMDQRSDCEIERENEENSDSDCDNSYNLNHSSSDDSSDDDRTVSIDVSNLLILNQNQDDSLNNHPNKEKMYDSPQKIEKKKKNDKSKNKNTNSQNKSNQHQSNKRSKEQKEFNQEKNIKENSSSTSQQGKGPLPFQKNNSKTQQGGIFQSTPYVNYMNSSKDNKINQTLISIQTKQDQNMQPNAVLTASTDSSKSKDQQINQQNINKNSKTHKDKQNNPNTFDSGSNNLNFIDMNSSNIVQNVSLQSQEDGVYNSTKKNPQMSLNVSSTSSVNANIISLSGSGNIQRSYQTSNYNSNSQNIYTKSDSCQLNRSSSNKFNNSQKNYSNNPYINQNNSGNINQLSYDYVTYNKPGQNQKIIEHPNNSFKYQQDNSINNSSIKNNKLDLNMSESQQYFPSESLQIGFDYSNEATPSKYEKEYSDNQNLQIRSKSQLDNKQSSPSNIMSREFQNYYENQQQQDQNDDPINQLPNTSPKKKQLMVQVPQNEYKDSQTINLNQTFTQSQDNNQNNQNADLTSLKSLQSNKKYLVNNYSAIIEESTEIKSCLSASVSQSTKIDGINGSILLNTQNFPPSLCQLNQSGLLNNQSQSYLDDQINSENKTIFSDRTIANKISQFSPLKKGFSQTRINNLMQALDSLIPSHNKETTGIQNQLDEVFGNMQSSTSYIKNEEDETDIVSNKNNLNNPPIFTKEQQISEEKINSSSINASSQLNVSEILNDQPPILKHRQSSNRIQDLSNSFNNLKISKDIEDSNKNEGNISNKNI